MFTDVKSTVLSVFLNYGILIEDEKLKNQIFCLDEPFNHEEKSIKGWKIGNDGWIHDRIYYIELVKQTEDFYASVAFADNVQENLIIFPYKSELFLDKKFLGLEESLNLFVKDFESQTPQDLEIEKYVLLEQVI